MKLIDYLHFQKKLDKDFAKEISVSRGYINQVKLGWVKPSARLAKLIELATAGMVTVKDLEDEFKREAKGKHAVNQ